LRRMALAIETAVRASAIPGQYQQQQAGHQQNDGGGGGVGPTTTATPKQRQVVHALQLVRGRPFYGYHIDEQLYIKVVLYNPQDVSRVANMLAGGAIMGLRLQPHESHLPFLLQFKIDFNLLGMGLLKLDRVIFRGLLPTRARPPAPGWEFLRDTYAGEEDAEAEEADDITGGQQDGVRYVPGAAAGTWRDATPHGNNASGSATSDSGAAAAAG
ncbi:hypothetical protein VaNZ11_005199, partial [Volvox africanus]